MVIDCGAVKHTEESEDGVLPDCGGEIEVGDGMPAAVELALECRTGISKAIVAVSNLLRHSDRLPFREVGKVNVSEEFDFAI